jgi:hypothetical protein
MFHKLLYLQHCYNLASERKSQIQAPIIGIHIAVEQLYYNAGYYLAFTCLR